MLFLFKQWVCFFQEETLTALTPTQVAQLTLSSGALNDTDTIDLIYERLEVGDAVENVDQFLTELLAAEKVGCFSIQEQESLALLSNCCSE